MVGLEERGFGGEAEVEVVGHFLGESEADGGTVGLGEQRGEQGEVGSAVGEVGDALFELLDGEIGGVFAASLFTFTHRIFCKHIILPCL